MLSVCDSMPSAAEILAPCSLAMPLRFTTAHFTQHLALQAPAFNCAAQSASDTWVTTQCLLLAHGKLRRRLKAMGYNPVTRYTTRDSLSLRRVKHFLERVNQLV